MKLTKLSIYLCWFNYFVHMYYYILICYNSVKKKNLLIYFDWFVCFQCLCDSLNSSAMSTTNPGTRTLSTLSPTKSTVISPSQQELLSTVRNDIRTPPRSPVHPQAPQSPAHPKVTPTDLRTTPASPPQTQSHQEGARNGVKLPEMSQSKDSDLVQKADTQDFPEKIDRLAKLRQVR